LLNRCGSLKQVLLYTELSNWISINVWTYRYIKIELWKINNFWCFRLILFYHGSWELVQLWLLEDWHTQDYLTPRKRKKHKNHRQETEMKFKIQSYSRKYLWKCYFLEKRLISLHRKREKVLWWSFKDNSQWMNKF